AVDRREVVQAVGISPAFVFWQIRLQDPDRTLEPLELAHQHRSVRPWAGRRSNQYIASGLGFETGRPIARSAIAKARFGTHKPPIAARHPESFLGRLFLVPNTVHEHAHSGSSSSPGRIDDRHASPAQCLSASRARAEPHILHRVMKDPARLSKPPPILI